MKLWKAFSNDSSVYIKFSKTQLSKIEQAEGFLGRILGPLLKNGFSLMKNILKPSANSVLIPLELTASASATNAVIQSDIMKIIKSLEDAGLLIKGVYEITENEAKRTKKWISQYVIRYTRC